MTPRVSRSRQPADMSLDAWQRELRRQFGREQKFALENLGDHPIFSDFRVTNLERRTAYRVAIRGALPGRNFCECPDFKTNALGTCKHVEYVLWRLSGKRGTTKALLAGYEPPYSSISLDYGTQRHVRFRAGTECRDRLRRLATEYFDGNGRLTSHGFDRFERFVSEAREIDPNLRIYEDVLAFVAEVRDMKRREEIVDRAFPRGVASKAFNRLLKRSLYEYQKEGALFAARAGRCLIGDDMGLGKTIEAIAAAEIMGQHLGVERVLVVCPTSLKHQWQREIETFSGRSVAVVQGLRGARSETFRSESFFKVMNYDTVHADLELIRGWGPDLVILDEAQRIKNWATRTARSVKEISSPYAIVLTGTPLENRLEELVSIVEFIDSFRLGPTHRFLHSHQAKDEDGRVIGYRNLGNIAKTLGSIVIRRRKAEVLTQLPERLEKHLFVPMTREQRSHHEENREIVGRIVAKWKRYGFLTERDQRRLMIALQMMRMSCDSTYLLDEATDHGTKADELMMLLEEILEEKGTKVVIFSQWTRMHELLMRRIDERRWGFVLFHGSVEGRKRKGLIDRFRDDPDCRLFLSTDAGGVGLNLQHASVVVNVDLPWNPAVLEQRIGRVHRMGQRMPVRVINLVAEGTIEHGMLSGLRFKKSLFAGVLDGGESEVFLGGSRLTRFMESVDSVAGEIGPVTVEEPEVPPEVAAVSATDASESAGVVRELHDAEPAGSPATPTAATSLAEPLAKLFENGVGLLQQIAAALPAESDGATRPATRRIESRIDENGEAYLAVPIPSREAVARVAEALQALLGSLGKR
ncbi:MAG TPA: DEAD/DEAH box helicase [Thermoanaerobaculia bacterium]|nr:DEAD/DEAH box helicase [Thermoanaerobaculia bacterium]